MTSPAQPSPHRPPHPKGRPGGGRHHITPATPFEHLAIHLARAQLDAPEHYQHTARRMVVAA